MSNVSMNLKCVFSRVTKSTKLDKTCRKLQCKFMQSCFECMYLLVPAAAPPELFSHLHIEPHQREGTAPLCLLLPLHYLNTHKHTETTAGCLLFCQHAVLLGENCCLLLRSRAPLSILGRYIRRELVSDTYNWPVTGSVAR